jgi:hypothetical protein
MRERRVSFIAMKGRETLHGSLTNVKHPREGTTHGEKQPMGEEDFRLSDKGKKGERMGIKQAKRGRIGQVRESYTLTQGRFLLFN